MTDDSNSEVNHGRIDALRIRLARRLYRFIMPQEAYYEEKHEEVRLKAELRFQSMILKTILRKVSQKGATDTSQFRVDEELE